MWYLHNFPGDNVEMFFDYTELHLTYKLNLKFSSVECKGGEHHYYTQCGFAVWVQGYNYSLSSGSSVYKFFGLPYVIISYCGLLFGNDFFGGDVFRFTLKQ